MYCRTSTGVVQNKLPCTNPVTMQTRRTITQVELTLKVINTTAQRFDLKREIILIQNKKAVMVLHDFLIEII